LHILYWKPEYIPSGVSVQEYESSKRISNANFVIALHINDGPILISFLNINQIGLYI